MLTTESSALLAHFLFLDKNKSFMKQFNFKFYVATFKKHSFPEDLTSVTSQG